MPIHIELDGRRAYENIVHTDSIAQRVLKPIGRSPIAFGAPPTAKAPGFPPLKGCSL